MHFLYSYCGRNVFSISLCHWTLMFRSRKPGDSDYYERCLICGEFEARSDASLQTLQNVGVGERGEGRRGEVWRVNRKLETSVPAWEAQSYQLTIYSQLYSLSQNNISLFPEVGLNLIINKWCLGSGFTQKFHLPEDTKVYLVFTLSVSASCLG